MTDGTQEGTYCHWVITEGHNTEEAKWKRQKKARYGKGVRAVILSLVHQCPRVMTVVLQHGSSLVLPSRGSMEVHYLDTIDRWWSNSVSSPCVLPESSSALFQGPTGFDILGKNTESIHSAGGFAAGSGHLTILWSGVHFVLGRHVSISETTSPSQSLKQCWCKVVGLAAACGALEGKYDISRKNLLTVCHSLLSWVFLPCSIRGNLSFQQALAPLRSLPLCLRSSRIYFPHQHQLRTPEFLETSSCRIFCWNIFYIDCQGFLAFKSDRSLFCCFGGLEPI